MSHEDENPGTAPGAQAVSPATSSAPVMPAHRNCFTFMRVCPPYLGSKSLFQCTPFPQRIQPEVLRAALRFRFGGVFGVVLHQLAPEFQGVLSPSPPGAGRGPHFISFRWAEVNPAQLRRTRGAGCRRQGESAPAPYPSV